MRINYKFDVGLLGYIIIYQRFKILQLLLLLVLWLPAGAMVCTLYIIGGKYNGQDFTDVQMTTNVTVARAVVLLLDTVVLCQYYLLYEFSLIFEHLFPLGCEMRKPHTHTHLLHKVNKIITYESINTYQ